MEAEDSGAAAVAEEDTVAAADLVEEADIPVV